MSVPIPFLQIPRSATNGWSVSWKKFMIEMAYLRGQVVLYPSFFNQTSLSTNHLEVRPPFPNGCPHPRA